jgi:hypothetical protein
VSNYCAKFLVEDKSIGRNYLLHSSIKLALNNEENKYLLIEPLISHEDIDTRIQFLKFLKSNSSTIHRFTFQSFLLTLIDHY